MAAARVPKRARRRQVPLRYGEQLAAAGQQPPGNIWRTVTRVKTLCPARVIYGRRSRHVWMPWMPTRSTRSAARPPEASLGDHPDRARGGARTIPRRLLRMGDELLRLATDRGGGRAPEQLPEGAGRAGGVRCSVELQDVDVRRDPAHRCRTQTL